MVYLPNPTLRWVKPQALLLAEYWGASRARALWAAPDGLGFDAGYTDQLREAIRAAVGQAATAHRPTSTWDG